MDNLDKKNETPGGKDNSQDADAKAKRHAEQMAGARAEVERQRKLALEVATKAVAENANYLVDLHDKDPKLAEEVAKQFNYSSYNEALDYINTSDDDDDDLEKGTPLTKEELQAWYKEQKEKEATQKALSKSEKIFNKIKDEEARKKAESYFKKLTDGKKITEKEATEIAEMATLYVSKDSLKSDLLDKGLINVGSIGVGGGKEGKSDGDGLIISRGKLLSTKGNE